MECAEWVKVPDLSWGNFESNKLRASALEFPSHLIQNPGPEGRGFRPVNFPPTKVEGFYQNRFARPQFESSNRIAAAVQVCSHQLCSHQQREGQNR